MAIELPTLLNIPEKLLPLVLKFNEFRYFLLEGGRGGGKSQAVARFLLYLGEKYSLRICCGRETQNSIDESVYTILKDIISNYNLNYEVLATKITHRVSGTTFIFKGFREQGAVNIKGLEGVDILWIDESQSVHKTTLDIIIPTIRKEQAKIIFSMNRQLRNDPVYVAFRDRDDCMHIHINYFDNPFCSHALMKEAEECKKKNDGDYEHIWLGEPLVESDDFLFTSQELDNSLTVEFLNDTSAYGRRIYGQDIARYGEDLNVAIILEQMGPEHWQEVYVEKWSGKDLMNTTGRIIDIKSRYKPCITTIDGDGMGAGVIDRLKEIGVDVVEFRGGMPCGNDLDKDKYANTKTRAYYKIKEMLQLNRLKLVNPLILKDLENIRFEYHSKGIRRIMSKEKMKQKYNVKSPDYADALMMAISETHNAYIASEEMQSKLPRYAITDMDINGPAASSTRLPSYAIH